VMGIKQMGTGKSGDSRANYGDFHDG
jgi:hypothetical protein